MYSMCGLNGGGLLLLLTMIIMLTGNDGLTAEGSVPGQIKWPLFGNNFFLPHPSCPHV